MARSLYVAGRKPAWIAKQVGIKPRTLSNKIHKERWKACKVNNGDGPEPIVFIPQPESVLNSGQCDIPNDGQSPSPEALNLTPEALIDANSRAIARKSNQLIVDDHKARQKTMWTLLERAKLDPELGAGKAGTARALADLTAVHERLLKLDRQIAGLDKDAQAQVVQAVIVVPEKNSVEQWLKLNVKG